MATVILHRIGITLSGSRVLSDVSCEAAQGAQVLLTGANGAGKTTLLRTIATALRPQAGTLSLFGGHSRAALLAARPRLCLMTHQHYFYEPLSALENIALVGRLSGQGTPAALLPLLERVGLRKHAHRPVATFSAGMKRRLALARVQLLAPELVLVDEPFSQLDAEGVALMQEALQAMAARQTTVIMATHDIERGRALCQVHWHLRPRQPGLQVAPIAADCPKGATP